jgi:RNA polymerase primary sigma factor
LANIANNGFSVKIPLNVMDDLRVILKLQKKKPNISQVEIEQYFEKMNYSENKIALTLDLFSNVLHHKSIFEPVDGSDEYCQIDLIRCEQPSIEDVLSKVEFEKFIFDTLMTLSKRDRFIIENRFGLNGETTHNLEEIGTMLGLTRERVRQISEKVLSTLKTKMKSKLQHYEFN